MENIPITYYDSSVRTIIKELVSSHEFPRFHLVLQIFLDKFYGIYLFITENQSHI